MDDAYRQLGWNSFLDPQVTGEELSATLRARVCAHYGSHIHFLIPSGDPKFEEISVPSAIVESQSSGGELWANTASVGDWYLLDPVDHRAIRRLERQSLIQRKAAGIEARPQLIAANVDTLFIVSSCNQDFNLSRLERYLALALEAQVTPVVVLTKADLCESESQIEQLIQSAQSTMHATRSDFIVEALDARDPIAARQLEPWCREGQTVALVGSSGVGKSTLANVLGSLDIKTSGIRIDDAKGRHTTTARAMHRLLAGGWLIDNPGMRELQLADCEQGVADIFDEVVQLAKQCKFRNCQHDGDDGCALQSAVDAGELDQRRLTNYLKLQREQARNSASLAERREKDRQTGKMYKRIISDKKRERRN